MTTGTASLISTKKKIDSQEAFGNRESPESVRNRKKDIAANLLNP